MTKDQDHEPRYMMTCSESRSSANLLIKRNPLARRLETIIDTRVIIKGRPQLVDRGTSQHQSNL
jgi:hypothetical protein